MVVKLKKEINKKCSSEDRPCALTFTISQNLQSFNNVVKIFSDYGFTVKEFVDDHLCVLSRDNEGFDEAVKVENNKVQIQASKSTLLQICEDLQDYCTGIE
ncbi:MAG: hypothetical protein ACFFDW_09700 [Candidatus Thorarchaeota archaeon]